MKKILLTISFFILLFQLNAQIFADNGFGNKWLISQGVLDVSTTSILYDSIWPASIIYSSIGSNSSLYYEDTSILYGTDGNRVVSYPGGLLPGGDSLSYHPSTGDSGDFWLSAGMPAPDLALILPGFTPETFSVFHLGIEQIFVDGEPTEEGIIPHLFQTTVTRTDSFPYGYVSEKRKIVFSDTMDQGLSAVRHGNGRDWLLVLNSRSREEQHVLRYDPAGVHFVQTQPFERDINLMDTDTLRGGPGESTFSPNGELFAKVKFTFPDTTLSEWLTIFDFDRCTGTLSEWIDFKLPNHIDNFVVVNSITFSPNSRYLYVGDGFHIYLYDLWAENVEASIRFIFDYNNQPEPDSVSFPFLVRSVRRMPSGNILVGGGGTTRFYHTISSTNSPADSSNLNWKALDSLNLTAGNFPNQPNYQLGPWDDSLCDTLGIDHPPPIAAFEYFPTAQDSLSLTFYDSSSVYVTNWDWDFGDGSSSTLTFPSHTFDSAGVYEVCLTVSAPSGVDTHCELLYLGVDPPSSITDRPIIQHLGIFPNPSSGQIRLDLGADFIGGELFVYNSTGMLLRSNWLGIDTGKMIDLSDLPTGMYSLLLRDADGGLKFGRLAIK